MSYDTVTIIYVVRPCVQKKGHVSVLLMNCSLI